MTKQCGLIKVHGTLDGVTFVKMNGENYVREIYRRPIGQGCL